MAQEIRGYAISYSANGDIAIEIIELLMLKIAFSPKHLQHEGT